MSSVLAQNVRRNADADDHGHCELGRDRDERICHRSSSRSVVMTVSWVHARSARSVSVRTETLASSSALTSASSRPRAAVA